MTVKEKIRFIFNCTFGLIYARGQFYLNKVEHKKEFEKLKNLHNKYKGERVFLCGNGPSLTIEDLNLLNGEYVCLMNSAITEFKNLTYNPEFYGFIDVEAVERHIYELENCKSKYIFYAKYAGVSELGWGEDKKLYGRLNNCKNVYEFPQMKSGDWIQILKTPRAFSEDISKEVYFGYTVTYSLLQILIYLGFNKIYLLGMDCNYSRDRICFAEERAPEDIERIIRMHPEDKYFKAYYAAKAYAEKVNVNIINATRGGMLEIFPRVALESVLGRGTL